MKKIQKTLIFCCLSLLLTGCVKYDITLDLSNGQDAFLQSTLLIDKETANSYDLDTDAIKKQLTANSDFFTDWQIDETAKTIDDIEYTGLIFTAPETVNEDISKHFTCDEEKDITTYTLDVNFMKSELDLSELQDYKTTLNTLKTNGATFEMIITMPGAITQSSIGTVSDNTVTIDMYDYLINGRIPEITVVSTEKTIDSQFYLYFSAGLIILAVLFFIHFLTKKKKKKDI